MSSSDGHYQCLEATDGQLPETISSLYSADEELNPGNPEIISRKIPVPSVPDSLSWPDEVTGKRRKLSAEEVKANREKIAQSIRTILECLGEDPSREGLLRTPLRYADALLACTSGYEADLQKVCNGALFEENHDEMVLLRDISLHSLCEHHMLPFWGRIHIAYIPNRRVLGLSKLARIAEMYSRRLQVQERLTKQIAMAVQEILQPQGVAVVVEAEHMCMAARGVGKPGSLTITSAMLGVFRGNAKTREEFLSLIRISR